VALEHAELEQLCSFCEWHGGGSIVTGYLCLVEIHPAEH
jgi:hypothetical protein